MDVTFTNILEGARQYFQGLPAATGSTASPAYSESHHRNDPEPNNEMPPSSSSAYWPPPQEPARPPTRELTPIQRPPSHQSDSSRPPSHSQQYMPNIPNEPSRSQAAGVNQYQNSYQEHPTSQQQHQSFQFSRPQSREAPSNFPQHQPQQYQSHIPTSSSYHQPPSPQQPRQELVQHPQTYHNSPPSRSYYNVQSQPKPVPSNNSYKQPSSSQSYPNQPQQNAYYKHIYSSQSQSQSQSLPQQSGHHNQYVNSRPSNVQEAPQHNLNTHPNLQNENMEQAFRTTHNLPPIAALSVNYHSSRVTREPSRPNSSSRPRTLSSSSSSSLPSSVPSSGSSIIQQIPTRLTPYSSDNYHNYRNVSSYTSQQSQPHMNQQNYQYGTATTQSYNNVIVTTTNSSSSYSNPVQSQSSSSNQYYQANKSNSQSLPRSQPMPNLQQSAQQSVVQQPNVNGRLAPVIKQKRESPLDLSVKTVRTPADSTLDDVENDARNKYYATAHRTSSHSTISTQNYPTYDVHSFQRNLTQRSAQLQSTGVPKFEFHPNFNVPSLNHQQPRNLVTEPQRNSVQNLPEKAHNKSRSMYDKNTPYPGHQSSSAASRYPTVSIPSAAHVNSYIQAQHLPSKKPINNGPRLDYPVNSANPPHKPVYPPHEPHKKRQAEMPPQVVPTKVPKIDSWRQTIDEQIEQRLSNYKQQQQQQKYSPSKSSIPNGSYSPMMNQDKSKTMYGAYQKQPYDNLASYCNSSPYNPQSNHNQTYVPSPATHQYPGYAGYTTQQPYLHHSSRTNSNPALPTMSNTKNNLGGAADKRVLSLLRNSLEVKEQKKLEQLKSNEHLHQHPRSDVQHPSTDVTAPLQPKPGFISRNNVSPFTPTSFPESNTSLTSMTKFQLPRAIDSVNAVELECKNLPGGVDKHLDDNHTMIPNHGSANSDYDGLAAFLAARIRTKGERKQVGPAQSASNNNTSNIYLQGIIENQLKSPFKQDSSQSSAYCSTSSNKSVSPPKLLKERVNVTVVPPRRRLFSRTEDDPGNNNVPPRDKSGLRSSSETSVFDFPDSDSENEMPVLERQSLEAMRRDRKSSVKTSLSNSDIKLETSRPPTPEDDDFALVCDNFVEQLKCGVGKKRSRRKKGMEPEVLAKLETVTKEKPLDIEVKVKIEVEEVAAAIVENKELPKTIVNSTPSTEESKVSNSVSSTDIKLETDVAILSEKKEKVRRRILSSSESSDSELETKTESVKAMEKAKEKDLANEEKKEEDSTKPSEPVLPPVVRPAKKPSFGDGSDFYPGWEEGVYKYKKSLRMPPSLIQVTRPPQFHRLSTSLPDLDPYPNSPTPSLVTDSSEFTKNKYKKIKSEPIDSDTESNCSFNLFSKQNNYDSEGGSSIKSLPSTTKENSSILDKLLEKYGARKRRKHKKKEESNPKVIPKSENSVELLPTPSLEVSKEENDKELKKLSSPVIKTESPLLGFRKTTINNFKDAFLKSNSIVGVNEQFQTVVLKSRTRKETRVLKQRATIKEVFGEDRPASAPPVTCLNDIQIKDEIIDRDEHSCLDTLIKKEVEVHQNESESQLPSIDFTDTKQMLKNKLLSKGRNKNDLLKNLVDKKIKSEIQADVEDVLDNTLDDIIKRDPDTKSETPSIDGDEVSVTGKKRSKLRNIRRKFSSGFDYIRKKKKAKKETVENDAAAKSRRRGAPPKTSPESVQDIQKEIKTWVLNKGIGETHLHRAARLGYTDITAYCLEKMECHPSPKDNAGYTPLHEACSRGHLDIAKLLLIFGANVSESAQGGIRPLHEAVENGFVEIVRLLLAYGADPNLATYSGLTPLSLANDDATAQLLKNHLDDVQGDMSAPPWYFLGPASCFELDDLGYNILDEVPTPDPELDEEDVEFEMSDSILPNLYTLRGEAPNDRWVLLQDLSNMLKIKSRDALLRQLCPSSSSAPVNFKAILRELKMSDFLEQAHCCQFLNTGEKINTRASKIALVKYTDKVRELLNVDRVLISIR